MVACQLRVYNRSGVLQHATDQFRSLTVEHRVNFVSTLTLAVSAGDPIVAYIDEDDNNLDNLIEVRRTVPEAGLDWYTEYVGFHRTCQRQITTQDQNIVTSYSRGLLDLIKRSSIRYYADTVGSAKGPAPADDVIKELVRENAGSLATTGNSRVVSHVMPGLAVAADLSQAGTHESSHAWQNLLDALQKICGPHNVDFDVVWLGGVSFEFRTYYPRLGTDRSSASVSPFIFSPLYGNATELSHTVSRTEEITSALVLGPGEGPLRDTTLRTDAVASIASPWNLVEEDVNASNEDRTTALEQVGDDLLYDKRKATSFVFEPIQTPLSTYRKHYFLGDLVAAQFSLDHRHHHDLKIRAVTLTISDDSETLKLDLEEIPA